MPRFSSVLIPAVILLAPLLQLLCTENLARAQGIPVAWSVGEPKADTDEKNGEKNGNGKNGEDKPRKTLLQWQFGKEAEDDGEEEEEVDEIPTDRPDFTENSRNVGLGRIQLEVGYTYTQDREGSTHFRQHSFPEALLRIGLFAEWFELRLGQNLGSNSTTDLFRPDARSGANGRDDLYMGVGLALTEQKGIFPESRINLQTRLPTGSRDISTDKVMPGFNYLYGWDVVKDKVTFAGSSQANRALDDSGHYYTEWAQALTSGITITKKLGLYVEWYGIFPSGSNDPGTGPEHYFDGGFTYKITPDFQLDIRAGVGLNRHADDFFVGSGFAYRY